MPLLRRLDDRLRVRRATGADARAADLRRVLARLRLLLRRFFANAPRLPIGLRLTLRRDVEDLRRVLRRFFSGLTIANGMMIGPFLRDHRSADEPAIRKPISPLDDKGL
jgi:hypothetical protein